MNKQINMINKRPHPQPVHLIRSIAALLPLLMAFCPLQAEDADAAMINQSSQTNLASLLERYPLADTIQDSPFLKQRAPFSFDKTLPERATPYPAAIRSTEEGYQMGNQFFRRGILRRKGMTPSLGQFLFGPAAIPEFEKAALEKQSYSNQGYLVADIGNLEIKDAGGRKIKLDGVGLLFRPHVLETEFGAAGINVKVSSAIDFSDMLEVKIVLTSDTPVTLSLSGSMNQPGKWYPESGMHLGQTVFKYVVGVDFSSSVEMKTSWMEEPLGYRVELAPSTRAELVLRFKPGYRGQDVRAALLSQRASDLSVAERSYREFADFFARVVPPFACSDQRLVDLYYFNAYAIRCAMVDIPFEPYLYPYLPYAKNYYGLLSMWPENVTSDMLFVRWLNDATFKEALLRKAMYQPHSPTLQPLPIGYKERLNHWDYRNLLATYEFAKTSANQQLVEQIKQLIREYAEKPLLNPWAEGMLCARDHMLAQYDESLRYKVFFDGEKWLGYRSKMNQPLAHIEENSWYYQILRMAAAFARADGDPSAQQLEERAQRVRSTINALMWDDNVGFYFDYATKDGKRSDVMSVAAFSTLWAGVPDRAQADRLTKEHLTNPAEFWGERVLPATSLADPRTNPRGYVDGGIILDVNNWFPFQGLLKMGYRDIAEELFGGRSG